MLESFLDMVKHYSITHRKILMPYYNWYCKNLSKLDKKPSEGASAAVEPPKVLPPVLKKRKKKLPVQFAADTVARIVDTEVVRLKEAEEEKNAVSKLILRQNRKLPGSSCCN